MELNNRLEYKTEEVEDYNLKPPHPHENTNKIEGEKGARKKPSILFSYKG